MKKKIVLASDNAGKISEISQLLVDSPIEIFTQSEFGINTAVEDQPTFVENALLKARHAAKHCKMPAIADDSGLEVDALGGEPGVWSSRYSGPAATDEANINKLLARLDGITGQHRSCRFRCTMVYLRHDLDPAPIIAQGTLDGLIHHTMRGQFGFGYDPIVWLEEQQCTLAELPLTAKNEISHRGKALRSLVEQLIHLVETDVA